MGIITPGVKDNFPGLPPSCSLYVEEMALDGPAHISPTHTHPPLTHTHMASIWNVSQVNIALLPTA